jgi:hypothetical protein
LKARVGPIRRNYLVPLPHAASFAALNERLADCRRRFGDRLRGQDATIGARLARDQACFCHRRVNSRLLARSGG